MPENIYLKKSGFFLALTAASISGVSIFLNKFAVAAISPPLVFTSVKNSLVALLIISLVVMTGKWRQIASLTSKQKLYLLAIGVIGGSLPFYLFFTGLSVIPALNGTLINKTMVLWVAILALPFLKEKLSRVTLFAVFLLFAANAFVGGFSGFKYSIGEGMVLIATLLWSVETIIAKKALSNLDPDLLTAARMGFGSLLLLSVSAILFPSALVKTAHLTSNQWFWLSLTAITLFAYVSVWYRALKHSSAIAVTSVMVASTLVTNILSAVFVTHSLNSQLLIQSLVIVAGVGLIYFSNSKVAPLAESSLST